MSEMSHDSHSCCHHHEHKESSKKLVKNGNPNAVYTCPMHPEIRQIGPGSCPKCGMALEPLIADDSENEELKDMSRRFWFATSLTLPIFLLAMGDMIPGQPISKLIPPSIRVWLELALATPVCLWSAWPFYIRAIDSIKRKSLNMFTA